MSKLLIRCGALVVYTHLRGLEFGAHRPGERSDVNDLRPRPKRRYAASVRFAGAIATIVLGCWWTIASCKRQHRRGPSDPEAAGADRPNERVAPASDPRFPRSADVGSDRRGFWVEQPRKTGRVSPTKLANAVAERLDELREGCCGTDRRGCASFDGRILLEIGLAPDGMVRTVEIVETTLYDRPFQKCLRRRVSNWSLAGHAGAETVRVSVPIRARFRAAETRDDAEP